MLRALTFLGCFLLAVDVQAMRFPEHPALPADYENEQEIVIVEVAPAQLRQVQATIRQKFPGIVVRQVYETTLCGLSVKGKRYDLRRLEQLPGVQRITPVSVYNPEAESIPFIGGTEARGYFDAKGRRLMGSGVKVGVIDTGIDYQHPDLRRSYAGGYDTVDRDHDPMESVSVGPTQHGTHVAGIIAANGKMQGVAPGARIYAYRALGPGGSGSTETVLAAIERAVRDRVDVVNLSLGNEINGPDWPTSVALNRAAEKGVLSVVASGNSGPDIWSVGSPGTASKAISVGASSPRLRIPCLTLQGRELKLTPLEGSADWSMPGAERWAFGGLGKPEELRDVRGKVALLERGELPFADKVRNAEKAGARAVVIYNNEPGAFSGSAEGAFIPVAGISREEGLWLRQQKDSFLRFTFREEADTIASFSSRGPVISTWEIKPDVVAPGVSIHSTVPGGYLSMQGTSMAAPHVAGAAALLKQAHPDWGPEQIKAALMNTAKTLYIGRKPYHIYEQGAGRIQLTEALQPSSLVYPASLPLGLVHKKDSHTVRELTVTVDNQTNKPQAYVFSQPPAERGIQWHMPHTLYMGPHEKKHVNIQAILNPSFLKSGIHEGYMQVRDYHRTIQLPYLFFVEEPNYPRIMGFQFGKGSQPGLYKYAIYVPGGADEMGIVLYDPATFQYVDFLDYRQNVTSGMKRQTILAKHFLHGTYKALVFVRKGKKEDTIETTIKLE
ncbi:S8 family serine peptidase [Ectobacillus ponti]|uniref:S8 family serine peptidase n=1 Tax=Ectobacillus ponti TaxID=2961894 RepID=UPI00244D2DC1|nr:S8 family serine peptidase [Ectobacillus ponti]